MSINHYFLFATLAAVGAGVFVWRAERREQPLLSKVGVVLLPLLMVGIGLLFAQIWSVAGRAWMETPADSVLGHYQARGFTSVGGQVWFGGFVPAATWVLFLAWGLGRHHGAKLLDRAALMVCWAYPVARVGCFFAGCCFGTWTNLPWGVLVREGALASILPRHPTNLYESLAHGLFFVFLAATWKRWRPGTTFGLFLIFHGAVRFLIEEIRLHPVLWLGWTSRQFVSLGLIMAGLATLRILRRRGPQTIPGPVVPLAAPRLVSSALAVSLAWLVMIVALDLGLASPTEQQQAEHRAVLLTGEDGAEKSLADWSDEQRPTLFYFWAEWCQYCRTDVDALNDGAERWRDRVAVLAVHASDDPSALQPQAHDLGLETSIASISTRQRELLGIHSLPAVLVADPRTGSLRPFHGRNALSRASRWLDSGRTGVASDADLILGSLP